MKPFNDYLDELHGKLKGFDDAERDEILEEVGSHIEVGVADGRPRPTINRRASK